MLNVTFLRYLDASWTSVHLLHAKLKCPSHFSTFPLFIFSSRTLRQPYLTLLGSETSLGSMSSNWDDDSLNPSILSISPSCITALQLSESVCAVTSLWILLRAWTHSAPLHCEWRVTLTPAVMCERRYLSDRCLDPLMEWHEDRQIAAEVRRVIFLFLTELLNQHC